MSETPKLNRKNVLNGLLKIFKIIYEQFVRFRNYYKFNKF